MADLFSIAVIRLVNRLNIPLVINMPGPNNMVDMMDIPMLKKNISIGGFTLAFDIATFFPRWLLPLRNMGPYLINSLVLFNSCPGSKFVGPSFSP